MKAMAVVVVLLATLEVYAQNTLTVNASGKRQTLTGLGMNVNSYMMSQPGDFRGALRMLVNVNGANFFRVIHDRVSWVECDATARPAATLANLQKLDHASLRRVYEQPDMQDLWNTIAELNANGVSGEQIIVNFMGWTPKWMGGICGYGANNVRDDAQTNQDYATLIASLVYYGHHRRELGGGSSNLAFSYISPFNEPDAGNDLEGPLLPGEGMQMNTVLGNIVNSLDTMGETGTKLVAPDTAGDPDPYTEVWSRSVIARTPHIAWHSYSDGGAELAEDRHPSHADWMTETSDWCSGCDSDDPISPADEWSFAADTGDLLLEDINNGFTAVLLWEAFDSYYHHHNSWSTWGHITYDRKTSSYTMRKRGYVSAIINRGLRPGMQVLELSSHIPGLIVVAASNSSNGWFSLVGHNTTATAQNVHVNAKAALLPKTMSYYQTNQRLNLQKQADLAVTEGTFRFTVPPDTFFLVTSQDPPVVSATAGTSITAAN